MRNFFICLFIACLSICLVVNEASAKRFGGGRSFGVQRSQSSLMSSHRPQPSVSAPRSPSRNWGGILGGVLAGGLLASLFMGNGIGSGILSWLIVGGVLYFLFSLFRKRVQPGMQASQSGGFKQSFDNFAQQFTNNNAGGASSSAASNYPLNFNPESFLRDAKVMFIRMQAAYDKKNIDDLTTFTAPEVFGEIKMQLDERGDTPNKTEIINLNAELLDVSKQFDSEIASVRFSGTLKENDDPITELDEIWHFRRFGNNKDWVVGGIQQG